MNKISIIIIVKNDREIKNTLNSLKKVKKPEKTEIIVIDSSKRETLLDIKKKFPNVKWFYYENKTGKKITIPEQRNMGIKKSKGDIIVFVDAGCTVGKDWLYRLCTPLLRNKEKISTGRVLSVGKNKIHDIDWKNIKSKYRDESGTANLAFKKSILNKIGLFNEDFSIGEDIDMTWKMTDAGYNILYLPEAIMYHNWGNFNQEIKRSFLYGKIRFKLYKHHKNKRKNLLKKDFAKLIYPLFIIGLPLTIFFPYYLLLLLIPVLKNINNYPFNTVLLNLITGLGFIIGMFNELFKKETHS